MNKQLFVFSSLLSVITIAQPPWFVSDSMIVNCERLEKKGQVTMTIEIRNKTVTIKDLNKIEEQTYVTRVLQSNRSKHWNNQEISLSVALKPSRWSRFFGGKNYHSGTLEIKSLGKQERYASLYCYPEATAE